MSSTIRRLEGSSRPRASPGRSALAGTTLPHAVRDIIFGLVVLGAVVALRDRQSELERKRAALQSELNSLIEKMEF